MPDLFDLEPESPPLPPVSITYEGYALAYDITPWRKSFKEPEPEQKWFISPESICETREQLQSFINEWGKNGCVVVRVKVEAIETEVIDDPENDW